MTDIENILAKIIAIGLPLGIFYAVQHYIREARKKSRKEKALNFQEINENQIQTFHDNGVLESQGELSLNIKEGKWKYWNDNGVFIKEEFYSKGMLLQVDDYEDNNRVKQSNYNNEVLYSEGYLINNIKNGAWKVYNEDGCLVKEEIFEEGRLKEIIEYEYPYIE